MVTAFKSYTLQHLLQKHKLYLVDLLHPVRLLEHVLVNLAEHLLTLKVFDLLGVVDVKPFTFVASGQLEDLVVDGEVLEVTGLALLICLLEHVWRYFDVDGPLLSEPRLGSLECYLVDLVKQLGLLA